MRSREGASAPWKRGGIYHQEEGGDPERKQSTPRMEPEVNRKEMKAALSLELCDHEEVLSLSAEWEAGLGGKKSVPWNVTISEEFYRPLNNVDVNCMGPLIRGFLH